MAATRPWTRRASLLQQVLHTEAGRHTGLPLRGRASSHHVLRAAQFALATRYALLITLLLAFALRVHLLGAQSLWNDEGSSYVQATRTLADIAYHAGRDIHPPGYYWLLAGWRALAGESEYALRLLSTFASVLTVAFTAALARRLFGTAAALAAALFVALNSFSIYYAQEARMYALLALWGTASLWLLTRILQWTDSRISEQSGKESFFAIAMSSRFRNALALGIVNAAGLYTQYAYIYVLLTQALIAALWWEGTLARRRAPASATTRGSVPTMLMVMGAQGLAFALFLPWLPTALTQITGWPNTGQAADPAQALNMILNWLIYGITGQNEILAVAWLLAIFGLTTLGTRRTDTLERGTQTDVIHGVPTDTTSVTPSMAPVRSPSELWTVFLPAAWVTVSVGVFMAQGLFREDNLKFLLPAQIGMALWMGRGFAALWHGWLIGRDERTPNRVRRALGRLLAVGSALLILAPMLSGLDPLYRAPEYQRADYRSIARLAEAELGAGDLVILNGPNQAEVFNYYYRGAAQVVGLPAGLGGDDAATRVETEALIAQPDVRQIFAVLWGDRERDPNSVVEGILDRETYSLSDAWYGDVRLAQYLMVTEGDDCQSRSDLLGTDISLICLQLEDVLLSPGDPLLVALEWRANTSPSARYKVFVQLLAPDGSLAAQHDAEPRGNSSPTTTWQADDTIIDRHALMIPPDALPGEYTLIAGMYALDPPNARLTLPDGSDHVVLGRVTVR